MSIFWLIFVLLATLYRPIASMLHSIANVYWIASSVSLSLLYSQVTDISDYNDANSLINMMDQVKGVYSKMKPIMDAAEDGVNLICYSQG